MTKADGRYLGSFCPDEVRIPEAMGPNGLKAVIETDDFDIPTVKVLWLAGMQGSVFGREVWGPFVYERAPPTWE